MEHPASRPTVGARIAIKIIRLYQRTSRWRTPVCRFQPTCSEYTCQAIQKYGFWRGAWMGTKRIFRCHPWSPGGPDPVP